MIVRMTHVRLAGPRALLDAVLALVQDLGVLHVVRTAAPGTLEPTREEAHARRMRDDAQSALTLLDEGKGAERSAPVHPERVGGKRAPSPFIPSEVEGPIATSRPSGVRARPSTSLGVSGGPPGSSSSPEGLSLLAAARRARRARRQATSLASRLAALEDERVMLLRYREFFAAFSGLLGHELGWPEGQAFYVVLRRGATDALSALRRSLEAAVGKEVELLARPLPSGELAVLILAASSVASKVGQLLGEARVHELPAPASLGEQNLLRALPALEARLTAIPRELQQLQAARRELAQQHRAFLSSLRAWANDRLLVCEARAQAHAGAHLFVLEGWLPAQRLASLQDGLRERFGEVVVVDVLGTDAWHAAEAPVEMKNPPLFRPFEVITRMVPLPRYGTIDPTPFVALFFPVFFGLMLGDVGYGALLLLVAALLRWRSRPRTKLRSVSLVAGACALTSVLFGLLFGELFGTLGTRLGLHPLAFDREHAVVPFLALSVAMGVVHITLGLVLAGVSAWRRGHRREAAGRSVAALMIALTVLALLAAFSVLPSALLTPFAIAALVAFPLLVALEGVVAVIELLSSYGHVLSYARIMALGTASLMLAVVANELVGALGSVVVGVVFALFFHLVNFGLGLFSPTIHALRLHYVEFFGKFYGPGGTRYQPLTHWQLEAQGA